MFIELVDQLRCVESHAESHLVAVPDDIRDRRIHSGTLGCPVCMAEYRIADGELALVAPRSEAGSAAGVDTDASEYEALRCGAMLDLQSGRGFALLHGDWGRLAPALADVSTMQLLLINPPQLESVPANASVVRTSAKLPPVAAASTQAMALDVVLAADADVAACAALVRGGGRLVAPVSSSLPVSARLLASDDRHWVAEVSHPALTTLRRRTAT